MIGSSLVSIFSSFVLSTASSIYWISICICYLLKHQSIHVISLCPSLKWTKEVSDSHTYIHTYTPTQQTVVFFAFFALSSLAFDQNFCFNYGYQCNNQIVWCAMCNQPEQGIQTIKVQKEIARTKAFNGLNQCK